MGFSLQYGLKSNGTISEDKDLVSLSICLVILFGKRYVINIYLLPKNGFSLLGSCLNLILLCYNQGLHMYYSIKYNSN